VAIFRPSWFTQWVFGWPFALPSLPYQPTGGSHEELLYGCGIGVCSFFLTLVVLAGKVTDAQYAPSRTFIQRLWNHVVPQGLKTDHCKLGILVGLIIGLSVEISVGLSDGLSNGY
jgi:hypothetical protein